MTQQTLELTNFHGNWAFEALNENVESIMKALSPHLVDNILRVIIGDMNSPLKPISYNSDITSICPLNLNGLWSNPSSSDLVIVFAVDGAFACLKQEELTCSCSSIDVLSGGVWMEDAKKKINLNYLPLERKYILDAVQEALFLMKNNNH